MLIEVVEVENVPFTITRGNHPYLEHHNHVPWLLIMRPRSKEAIPELAAKQTALLLRKIE